MSDHALAKVTPGSMYACIYMHALGSSISMCNLTMDGSGGVSGVVCHLQCEISSVEVTGLGCTCTGGGGGGERALFLRCYVPAGGGRTIQIDSCGAEAAERPDAVVVVSWGDVASLRCDGSPACVRELAEERSVAFEVRRRRRRRRAVLLGRALGYSSELVGRAEVAWRDVAVAEAGDDVAAVERRVALAAPARGGGGTVARDDAAAAAPVMSVRMSVRVSETAAPAGRSVECSAAHQESCGCEWSVGEEDVLGVVACGVADGAFE